MSAVEEKVSFADFKAKFLKKQQEMMSKGRPTERAAWMDRAQWWSPQEAGVWVRLIPGDDGSAYHTFYQAFYGAPGKKRPIICNCEAGSLDRPCVLCYKLVIEHEKDPEKKLAIPMLRYATTVFIAETFHKVKRTSASNTEFTDLVQCAGVNRFGKSVCDHCDNDAEKVFGNKKHWTMSRSNTRTLTAAIDELSRSCSSCGDGFVSPAEYACSSCGHVLLGGDRAFSEEEFLSFDSEEKECPSCNHVGLTDPILQCTKTNRRGEVISGCDNPAPTDVSKSEFLIRVEVDGKNTKLIVDGIRPWSDTTGVDEWKLKPYDFKAFLSYMDLEEQARVMGIENPFDDEAQSLLISSIAQASRTTTEHTIDY